MLSRLRGKTQRVFAIKLQLQNETTITACFIKVHWLLRALLSSEISQLRDPTCISKNLSPFIHAKLHKVRVASVNMTAQLMRFSGVECDFSLSGHKDV